MTRLPVSSLLLVGTVGATLALTSACGGGDKPSETGGTSGTGPSSGGAAAMAGTSGSSGSAGQATMGGTGGANPTGGSSGTGGAGGTGGANPMGGTSGAGVAAGAGMAGTGNPAGGSAGMAGGGTAGTGATTDCMVTPTATQSETIGTVFNIAVTTTLPGFDGGQIDFGLDTNYGYTAPLDMAAGKTTLLGMKANKDYHYRVTVKAGATTCMGVDQTVTTTDLINGFPPGTIATPGSPDKLSGGFMISEFYAGQRKAPYILDKDLEMVWAYDPKFGNGGDTTRARMSIDGKWMWIAHGNVPSAKGLMKKIAMDGSSEMDMSDKFVNLNHDFTIIDDANQTMYFIAYGASGAACDDIVEFDPVTGANRTVMNTSAAFDDGGPCHCNAIDYSPMDDTLIVSDLDHHALIKIDRKTGATKWVLNGCAQNDFMGEGSTWTGPEHNFHILGPDHILIFNNVVGMGSMSGSCAVGSTGSLALEIKLDEPGKTATKMWSYLSSSSIKNVVMGDVQRMANGNTIIAYSTQGIIHEVDAAGTLLQSITYGTGGAIGYILKRPTLYGKPIR